MSFNDLTNSNWLEELFQVKKPIIAMCHLQPLPGDPYYDEEGGMEKVIECAIHDVTALQNAGLDGIMFSNEFSLPYHINRVEPITLAAMGFVIGQVKEMVKVPFGVNCLWDPESSLDLAKVTGAKFMREVISGVYAADFGLWNTNSGETARHRHRIGADNVRMLYNIVPDASAYLSKRDVASIAKTTEFNCRPDVLCVSGITAGAAADFDVLTIVKNSVTKTPVFANTGCTKENIVKQLEVADGACVATTLKVDGKFENPVDEKRAKEFMDVVKEFRKTL